MTDQTPLASNPVLLQLLDALAAYLIEDSHECRVFMSTTPDTSPMRQWWEITDTLPGYDRIQWGTWVTSLHAGRWPDLGGDTADADALEVAMRCFPCKETKEVYLRLASDPHHAPCAAIHPLETPSTLFSQAHEAMLNQLCQRDQQYFMMAESLGLAWHTQWATRQASVLTPTLPSMDCEND